MRAGLPAFTSRLLLRESAMIELAAPPSVGAPGTGAPPPEWLAHPVPFAVIVPLSVPRFSACSFARPVVASVIPEPGRSWT